MTLDEESQIKTVLDVLKAKIPDVITDWYDKAWDYNIRGPQSMDDLALVHIKLYFGTEHNELLREFQFNMLTGEIKEI